jgi:hypothetical protein
LVGEAKNVVLEVVEEGEEEGAEVGGEGLVPKTQTRTMATMSIQTKVRGAMLTRPTPSQILKVEDVVAVEEVVVETNRIKERRERSSLH